MTAGDPPPEDAYESGQYSPARPRAAGSVDAFQRFVTHQPLRFLRRAGLREGARVLDVGAGPGRMVGAFVNSGYEARGIEPSRRSSELAMAKGLAVLQRDLWTHADDDLDGLVLWHVLEHIDDPAGGLERMHGWLRPGGLVMVGVPNAASLQADIGGEGWLHWDAPRHRVHFTADGITRLLARSGFEPVRTHHLVLEQNLHGMWFALLTRMGMRPGFPFHFLKRNIDARPRDIALTALGVPLIPVACALEAGAAAVRRGGTIAVIARAS